MQPAIPQSEKWDPSMSQSVLTRIERNTLRLVPMQPDVIFWPEATLPYPIKGDPAMRAWAERVATQAETPIFAGALVAESEEVWKNGVYLIRPRWGIYPKYYSKRHLVPFGEYIPLGAISGHGLRSSCLLKGTSIRVKTRLCSPCRWRGGQFRWAL